MSNQKQAQTPKKAHNGQYGNDTHAILLTHTQYEILKELVEHPQVMFPAAKGRDAYYLLEQIQSGLEKTKPQDSE